MQRPVSQFPQVFHFSLPISAAPRATPKLAPSRRDSGRDKAPVQPDKQEPRRVSHRPSSPLCLPKLALSTEITIQASLSLQVERHLKQPQRNPVCSTTHPGRNQRRGAAVPDSFLLLPHFFILVQDVFRYAYIVNMYDLFL